MSSSRKHPGRLRWPGQLLERLRNPLRSLTQPVRKLAFHDGAYRNLATDGPYRPGCNLIGYPFGEFGIGQHLRGVAAACDAAGIDFSVHDYRRTLHRQEDRRLRERLDPSNPHRCNLFCLNAGNVLDLWEHERGLFEKRYNIGYGFWELSDFPDLWLPSMNILDEIWAPSRYVQQVMTAKASLPVVHMPLAVDFEVPSAAKRRDYDLPEDATIFLFTFDFSSRLARKNPLAVVEAFRRAFPDERQDVALVLKTKTVDGEPDQMADREQVVAAIRGDRRIRLIDETWPHTMVLALIYCCDVYVSLHRAEGFGLGMAEAMRMGKPVIATDYSGNTDFTLADNACLVDFRLIDVEAGEHFDLEGESVWADPDVEQAAEHMRFLATDRDAAAAIGERGRRLITQAHSAAAIGAGYRRRLERIALL